MTRQPAASAPVNSLPGARLQWQSSVGRMWTPRRAAHSSCPRSPATSTRGHTRKPPSLLNACVCPVGRNSCSPTAPADCPRRQAKHAHVAADPEVADAGALRRRVRQPVDVGGAAGLPQRQRQAEVEARAVPQHDRGVQVRDQLLSDERAGLATLRCRTRPAASTPSSAPARAPGRRWPSKRSDSSVRHSLPAPEGSKRLSANPCTDCALRLRSGGRGQHANGGRDLPHTGQGAASARICRPIGSMRREMERDRYAPGVAADRRPVLSPWRSRW